MKCAKCGNEVSVLPGEGLHICGTDDEVVIYELRPQLQSIMEVLGACVACGFACKLRDTAVDPDYTTPRCPKCNAEWRAESATTRSDER